MRFDPQPHHFSVLESSAKRFSSAKFTKSYLAAFAAVGLMLSPSQEASAQEGVIDYLTASGSAPLSAYVVVEPSPGSVQVFPAAISEIPNSTHSLVSTEVPTSLGRTSLGVAFIIDPLRESPPVQVWSADAFMLNMLSTDALSRDILDLDQKIQQARLRFVDSQDTVQELEQTLSSTLEISELREAMEQKRELERSISDQQREIARLEVLLDEGRQMPLPDNVSQLRLTLADHLRQAAQVTAAADRLTRRKLEVAKNRLLAKLKRIQELKQENPEELARKVLELRAKRRELEIRLGKTSTRPGDVDQF